MKLCIPTQSDIFAEARISPHFGKAQYHLVAENQKEVARHNREDRPSGSCAPIDWIVNQGVSHVICLGIGDGAFRRLRAAGISVLHAGKNRRIDQVLSEDSLQDLNPFDPANLCDHHHHD